MKRLKLLTLVLTIFTLNISANEPNDTNNGIPSVQKAMVTPPIFYSQPCSPYPKCQTEESYYFLDLLKQSFPSESKENNNKSKDNPSQ